MVKTCGLQIDTKKLTEAMKAKGLKQKDLAEATGLDYTTINKYITGASHPSKVSLNAICFALGIAPKDLELEKPKPVSAVDAAIASSQNSEEIKALNEKVDRLQDDLGKLATILLSVQKVGNETKAQAELNQEQIAAVFNKFTEINSTVSKIYAKIGQGKRY